MVRIITLCVSLALLPAASHAQVYKCTDTTGKVGYQSTPCMSARQDRPAILKPVTPGDRQPTPSSGYTAGRTTQPAPPPPPPVQEQPRTVVNNYQTVIIQPDTSAQDTPPDNKQDACDWARDKRSRTEKYYRSHSIDMPWDVKHELDDLVFEKC